MPAYGCVDYLEVLVVGAVDKLLPALGVSPAARKASASRWIALGGRSRMISTTSDSLPGQGGSFAIN